MKYRFTVRKVGHNPATGNPFWVLYDTQEQREVNQYDTRQRAREEADVENTLCAKPKWDGEPVPS